jgi:hypothetical protein
VILFYALFASIARLFLFPAADYPDAQYVYPRAFFSDILSGQDYILNVFIGVEPSNPSLSLVLGSVYDTGISNLPSLKYWLISSLPFFLLAGFAHFYLISLSPGNHKRALRKLLILFFVCPSSSYYLCTLHPEAWANVLALGYTVTVLTLAFSQIYSYRLKSADIVDLKKNIHLGTFVIFALSLLSGFFLLEDSQFILCLVGISCFYLTMRSSLFGLVSFPLNSLQTLRSICLLRLAAPRKTLSLLIPFSFIIFLLFFSYSARDLLLSAVPANSSLGAALSLYDIDSIFADKYPLWSRPFFTLNNLFIYTPAGFGPSAFLKILILCSIVSSWFGAVTGGSGRAGQRDFLLASRLLLVLLFPLPIILLLPGYVNLKYYIFLVPVLFFFPSLKNYKTLLLLFVALWVEFVFRALYVNL